MPSSLCSLSARVLIGGLFLPATLVAQSVSIQDIRIPSSTSRRFTLTLDHFAFRRSGTYEEIWPLPPSRTYDDKQGNTSSRAGLFYEFQEFDENKSNGVFLNLRATNDANDRDRSDTAYREIYKSSRQSVSFSPSLNTEFYLTPDAWFLRGYFGGTGQYTRQKQEYDYSSASPQQFEYWSLERSYDVVGGVGGGYGKVRDGQNVFSAVRVLQQLEEDSALVRPLRTEEILRISDIMARRSEYYRLFDRSDKYIIRDVIAALRSMNALRTRSFEAYDAVRLVEVIHEGVQYRLTGWKVWAMVEHRSFQTHREGREYTTLLATTESRGKREYVETQGEYGIPLSLSSHVYGRLNVKVQFSDRRRNIDWELFGRYSYEVTDRLELYSEIVIHRDNGTRWARWDPNFQNRYVEERLNAGGSLFLEDRVYLTVSGGLWLEQNNSGSDNTSPVPRAKHVDYQLSIGLNFRLL